MSGDLTKQELNAYLADMTPAEIRARFGDRLDEASHAHLRDFEAVEARLGTLGEDLARVAPAPPKVRLPAASQSRRRQPWWRRGVTLPSWALVAAGLLLALGLAYAMWPRPGLAAPAPVAHGQDPVEVDEDIELRGLNRNISRSYFLRGIHYYAMNTEASYRLALDDFERAIQYNPKHAEPYQYLVMTCEALGLDGRAHEYRQVLKELNLPPVVFN